MIDSKENISDPFRLNIMIITPKEPIENARSYALRILKQNLISLDLEPGSLLSEKELAIKMGISRTPIREALIELSRVGIVTIFPQKGTQVALIDYSLVEEARFIRIALEKEVVKILCETATDKTFEVLNELVQLQDLYLALNNPTKLLELDDTFHATLFMSAGKINSYNWLNEGMNIHFDRVRKMSLEAVKNTKIVEDHRQIIEALKIKDAHLGQSLVEKHLSRYKIDEETIRKAYPKKFFINNDINY